MDTGLEKRQPHRRADQRKKHRVHDANAVGDGQYRQQGAADGDVDPRDVARVEEGYDDDGPDVVDDRNCGQKDLEAEGRAAPKQGEHAQREGDVRRHRDSPSGGAFGRRIEGCEYEGGHDHPPNRGDNGERRTARRGQLASHQLSLDLQANDEEEHRHQRVVDPEMEGFLDEESADAEPHLGGPEALVAALPRRVCPDHRGNRARHEHNAPGGLFLGESLERTYHPLNGRLLRLENSGKVVH